MEWEWECVDLNGTGYVNVFFEMRLGMGLWTG